MRISEKTELSVARRLALSAAIWLAFILIAHEAVHRFFPVREPVPGAGLKMLGAQALAVTLGTLALLAARKAGHLITLRVVLATAIWVSLIVAGHYLSHLDALTIRQTLAALHEAMGMGALLASAAILAILLGLPFVPSVEMGLMMMAVFGREGAITAWLATIAGLALAHAAGRYMPVEWMRHWMERHALLPADADEGQPPLLTLMDRPHPSPWLGRRLGALLLRHRYLLFAALINMPGNSVLGGGGGIALVCGFTRLYRWPLFIVTVALASLPIPLLVFLGFVEVDRWLAVLD